MYNQCITIRVIDCTDGLIQLADMQPCKLLHRSAMIISTDINLRRLCRLSVMQSTCQAHVKYMQGTCKVRCAASFTVRVLFYLTITYTGDELHEINVRHANSTSRRSWQTCVAGVTVS